MIRKFKFFRGYVGTIDMMDGQTYATASLNTSANVIEHNRLQRDLLMAHERIRRENHVMERAADRIILSNVTRVTTINPTPWTKVKIFGTHVKLFFIENWKSDPIGLVVCGVLLSIVTYIGIAKLFFKL